MGLYLYQENVVQNSCVAIVVRFSIITLWAARNALETGYVHMHPSTETACPTT